MKPYYFLMLFGFAVTASNCKKDKTTPKTKTELVSSSSWKYESAGIDGDNNGTGETPMPPGILLNCQTDNVLVFMPNGTGTVDEGSTKCNVGDPQIIPFNWKFTNAETVINFSAAVFAGVGDDFKIISLTETQLVLSKQLTVPIPVTVVVTFRH